MTGVCEAFPTQKTRLTRDTWHKELAADRKASFKEVVGSFKKAIFEGTKEVRTDVKTEVRVSPRGLRGPLAAAVQEIMQHKAAGTAPRLVSALRLPS